MNLFQLEYFVKLAETLSYTKASAQLHVSQPTLSKLIVNLEHSLGTALFTRSKRNVKLTPAGRIFYAEVKNTLEMYQQGIEKVRELKNGVRSVINIGIMGTALIKAFPHVMDELKRRFPEIKINPIDHSYDTLIQKLNEEEIDLALMPDFLIETSPQILKRPMYSDRLCVVVNRRHRFSHMESVSLSMIKDEPFIHMKDKYSRVDRQFIDRIFKAENIIPNTVYDASSLLNMMLMSSCDIGITLLAEHMKRFANDNLVFIPLAGYEEEFKICCFYHRNSEKQLEDMISAIEETLTASSE